MKGFLNVRSNSRTPIYGEQVHSKLGYVESCKEGTFFQGLDGRRIAKVIRYKQYQAPQAQCSLGTSGVIPHGNRWRIDGHVHSGTACGRTAGA